MYYPALIPFLCAILAGVVSIAYAYRNRDERGAIQFAGVIAVMTLFSTFAALQVVVDEPDLVMSLYLAGNLILNAIPILWLYFVFVYTGRTNRSYYYVLYLIIAEVLIYCFILLAPNVTGYLYTDFTLVNEPYVTIESTSTIFHTFHTIIHQSLVAVGIVFIFRSFNQASDAYKKQVTLLTSGAIMALFSQIISYFNIIPSNVPTLPIGFTVFGFLATFALYRYQTEIDVTPLARRRLLQNMEDAVLVVDEYDRIIDYNENGAALLETDSPHSANVVDELPDDMAFDEEFHTLTPSLQRVSHTDGADTTHYQASSTPIQEGGDTIGRVLILQDITQEIEQQEKLERQHERHDKFATAVEEDIRNPLADARDALQDAKAADDETDEPFGVMEEAHAEIDTLIENILAFARQGQSVDEAEMEAINFRENIRKVWDDVTADFDAVETDVIYHGSSDDEIIADPKRFRTGFEHIFENAIVHGDADEVAIHPADDSGFRVVERGGNGVSVEDKEDIMIEGYSTIDGTGFGTNIILATMQAHNWDVDYELTDRGINYRVDGVRFN